MHWTKHIDILSLFLWMQEIPRNIWVWKCCPEIRVSWEDLRTFFVCFLHVVLCTDCWCCFFSLLSVKSLIYLILIVKYNLHPSKHTERKRCWENERSREREKRGRHKRQRDIEKDRRRTGEVSGVRVVHTVERTVLRMRVDCCTHTTTGSTTGPLRSTG